MPARTWHKPVMRKSVRGKEVYMIITIARQCGCMGDQIGKALAEKYFIPFMIRMLCADWQKRKVCMKSIHILWRNAS